MDVLEAGPNRPCDPAMRALIALALLTLPLAAQSGDEVTKLLERGMEQAIAGITPVPAAEQKLVLEESSKLLSRAVSFRADGSASAIDRSPGIDGCQVEWKKLVVRHITKSALSPADRANGITRRYMAALACETSRSWIKKENRWSEWSDGGYLLFPSAIIVQEQNGKISASASRIQYFSPAGAATAAKPAEPSGIFRRHKDGTLTPVQ